MERLERWLSSKDHCSYSLPGSTVGALQLPVTPGTQLPSPGTHWQPPHMKAYTHRLINKSKSFKKHIMDSVF